MYSAWTPLAVDVHAIGRYKGIVSTVKDVEKPLVEGQPGTQYGGNDYVLLFRQGDVQLTQRGLDGLGFVLQGLRQFEGHHLTDAFHVVAEGEAVFLIVLVAQLSHVVVDDAVLFSEIDNLHFILVF